MDLAGQSIAEPSTERLPIKDTPHAGRATRRPWRRPSPLMLASLLASCATVVMLGSEIVFDAVTGIGSPECYTATAALVGLAYAAFLAAGLRDFSERRGLASEERIRSYVQYETFRLEQGQARVRDEIALMRAEMIALLGSLPDGVVAWGDDRDDEGEQRAVRRLTAATDANTAEWSAPRLRSVGPN